MEEERVWMAEEAADRVDVVESRCCERKTEFCSVLFHRSAVSLSFPSHITCVDVSVVC